MMFGRNAGAERVVERIPPGTVGVEIGVWRGDSSEKFLQRASHLHLVDPWSVAPYEKGDEFPDYKTYLSRYSVQVGSSDPKEFQKYYDGVHDSVARKFSNRPVTIHRCTSVEFFESFKGVVDWVYIDGLHGFASCLADLRGALGIVRPGGLIFGDDYGHPESHRLGSVTKAVRQFVMDGSLTFTDLGLNQYEIRL